MLTAHSNLSALRAPSFPISNDASDSRIILIFNGLPQACVPTLKTVLYRVNDGFHSYWNPVMRPLEKHPWLV